MEIWFYLSQLCHSLYTSPHACYVLKGICFLEQKVESKERVHSWTCEICSVCCFQSVRPIYSFQEHVWSWSKADCDPLWRHHWGAERHLQAAPSSTWKGKVANITTTTKMKTKSGVQLPWLPHPDAWGSWLWGETVGDGDGPVLYWQNHFHKVIVIVILMVMLMLMVMVMMMVMGQ